MYKDVYIYTLVTVIVYVGTVNLWIRLIYEKSLEALWFWYLTLKESSPTFCFMSFEAKIVCFERP